MKYFIQHFNVVVLTEDKDAKLGEYSALPFQYIFHSKGKRQVLNNLFSHYQNVSFCSFPV